MADSIKVGRVLRSTTANFTVGCQQLIADQDNLTPQLGALLRADGRGGEVIYGMTFNVTIEDDAFVRQLVAAGEDRPEYIEDQRQRRQVPVVIDVQTVGFGKDGKIFHRLPPQPPRTLDVIYTCNGSDTVRFTERQDWLRLIISSLSPNVDQVIVAALRAASEARPTNVEREQYLVSAGRELAKLLALDLSRLDGILTQLR